MSKIRYYLLVFVCLIIILNTLRSFGDYFKAKARVTQTQDQLDALQQENARLEQQKKKVDSPDFVEEEARNRLGFSKPGETIVVLPEDLQAGDDGKAIISEPNWQKWWKLIF